jgi:hypothetical protein
VAGFWGYLVSKHVSRISALISSLVAMVVFILVLFTFKLLVWYALPIAAAAGFVTTLVVSAFTEPLPEAILDKIAAVK